MPKQLGIFVEIDSANEMTTELIIDRIIQNRYKINSYLIFLLNLLSLQFESRNRKKERKEVAAFKALQRMKLEEEQGNGVGIGNIN